MKKMIFSACACFAVALLCFGFLQWNSDYRITGDPVQVVKLTTPCQYLQRPTGQLLPGTELTYQSLKTGRLYGPPLSWCSSDPSCPQVGSEDVTLVGSTSPGYIPPPSSVLTLIRFTGVFALALGFWLLVRLWRAARKTNVVKG